MPPLPVIANCFRVTLNWTHPGGTTSHNVMHFSRLTGTTLNVMVDIQDTVDAAMWDPIDTDAAVTSVDILPLDGFSSTDTYATIVDARWAGGTAGEALIAPAFVVRFKTGERGRSRRGRIYLPFISEASTNGGIAAGTSQADLEAAWNTFADDLASGTSTRLVVASYKEEDYRAVTNCEVPVILGTMKRRQDALRS